MSTPTADPLAATITVAETLGLLDGAFAEMAQGVGNGRYAFWLGSGISRGRVPGLDRLVPQVLEFLRARIDPARPDCPHREALDKALSMAALRDDELLAIDLNQPVASWPPLTQLVRALTRRYSELLDIEVRGQRPDYLVWDGIDVRATYGKAGDPGCEHIALAILALEGVVTDAPMPNWDGLIERALDELAGRAADMVRVVVLPEDLRDAKRPLTLFKFHGCAVMATADPDKYRASLVARKSQISEWPRQPEIAAIRQELVSLATTRPTLMIGLSAQDPNIQDIFYEAKARMQWPWPSDPPAHVFAEDELGDDHTNLLRVVYRGAYEGNEAAIVDGARLRAYGEQLLTALVLHVLAAKLRGFLQECDAPLLDQTARDDLEKGLPVLRDAIASHAEPDRLAFIRALIAAQTRTLTLFQTGTEPAAGATEYRPVSTGPTDRIANESTLQTSGLPEMAAALSLLGRGTTNTGWNLGLGLTAAGTDGALKLVSSTGMESAVFFAANGRAGVQIEGNARSGSAAEEVVIIHSTDPVEEFARSPHGRYGRGGDPLPRHVDMSSLLKTSSGLADLETRFRQAAAL
ncbi:MAG TPA: SIR2 family protein [Conexibacter sp.]|nr:SIR2 family protein [Conexibacter sp.]